MKSKKSLMMIVVLAVALILTACSPQNNKPKQNGISDQANQTQGETAVKDSPTPLTYTQIDAQQAKTMMDSEENFILLDVRTQGEFEGGHIPGAQLLPNETIGAAAPEELPDKEQLILIYCRSGNRSKQAAQKLVNLGYTNIYEFGGINSWPYDLVK